jgi:predicted nucleic acid-binding protein
VIVVDSGPLVAAALHRDVNHIRCVELFTSLHLNAEPLMVPSLVVTEVC